MPVLETTSNLLAELQSARTESDRLFSILTSEALYERPIAQRHRVIFYIGHLDGFDSIQICREALDLPSPDRQFDSLFQAGIDPDSSHLPQDTPADWPSLDQVKAYVDGCRAHVDKHLDQASEDVVSMALEHRLMHMETLAYMFHNFDYGLKKIAAAERLEQNKRSSPANRFIEVPCGDAVLGKTHNNVFGWDNEFEETVRRVPAFRIQQNSVTNGDYLSFVEGGAPLPHFWVKRGGDILYRGMFEEIALPLDWPVYVTQREADAYARSMGYSLPSEEQFHRAAYPEGEAFPWGDLPPSASHGNFDFRRWDPEPVDATPQGGSRLGVNQLVGNGWQWTSTPFGPLPGFQPKSTYPGYSANFFDGEHYVLKGGSARTAARLLRRSFRNWFRRDYPYMYATFRCVEN
ncbi:MAG TPA: SUMF1/EgtB/PvdO family nonheme iron enzyme [Bryobacteraceae bacterium]|jgi:formylglycine-generating enzyme required for sulfatase activity|nr:SUMF1/EgtB/PvdO family nonheme iron enzyme [Bryobacteraceae bacterium]